MFRWLKKLLFGMSKERHKKEWGWAASELSEDRRGVGNSRLWDFEDAARQVNRRNFDNQTAYQNKFLQGQARQERLDAIRREKERLDTANRVYDKFVALENTRDEIRQRQEKLWGITYDNGRGRE